MASLSRTVAVLGASSDRRKFGNKAVRAYAKAGWRVFPIHPTETVVEGWAVFQTLDAVPETIEAISVYVPASISLRLLPEIAAAGPREIWFNPGAESPELKAEVESLGLPATYGCSILALGHSPSEFPNF